MTSTISVDAGRLAAVSAQAAGPLKRLANPERLLLLCELSQGERRVGELEQRLSIRQPPLSQQLGVLRSEGLVGTRRDGKHITTASRMRGPSKSWRSCTACSVPRSKS